MGKFWLIFQEYSPPTHPTRKPQVPYLKHFYTRELTNKAPLDTHNFSFDLVGKYCSGFLINILEESQEIKSKAYPYREN